MLFFYLIGGGVEPFHHEYCPSASSTAAAECGSAAGDSNCDLNDSSAVNREPIAEFADSANDAFDAFKRSEAGVAVPVENELEEKREPNCLDWDDLRWVMQNLLTLQFDGGLVPFLPHTLYDCPSSRSVIGRLHPKWIIVTLIVSTTLGCIGELIDDDGKDEKLKKHEWITTRYDGLRNKLAQIILNIISKDKQEEIVDEMGDLKNALLDINLDTHYLQCFWEMMSKWNKHKFRIALDAMGVGLLIGGFSTNLGLSFSLAEIAFVYFSISKIFALTVLDKAVFQLHLRERSEEERVKRGRIAQDGLTSRQLQSRRDSSSRRTSVVNQPQQEDQKEVVTVPGSGSFFNSWWYLKFVVKMIGYVSGSVGLSMVPFLGNDCKSEAGDNLNRQPLWSKIFVTIMLFFVSRGFDLVSLNNKENLDDFRKLLEEYDTEIASVADKIRIKKILADYPDSKKRAQAMEVLGISEEVIEKLQDCGAEQIKEMSDDIDDDIRHLQNLKMEINDYELDCRLLLGETFWRFMFRAHKYINFGVNILGFLLLMVEPIERWYDVETFADVSHTNSNWAPDLTMGNMRFGTAGFLFLTFCKSLLQEWEFIMRRRVSDCDEMRALLDMQTKISREDFDINRLVDQSPASSPTSRRSSMGNGSFRRPSASPSSPNIALSPGVSALSPSSPMPRQETQLPGEFELQPSSFVVESSLADDRTSDSAGTFSRSPPPAFAEDPGASAEREAAKADSEENTANKEANKARGAASSTPKAA